MRGPSEISTRELAAREPLQRQLVNEGHADEDRVLEVKLLSEESLQVSAK